MTRKFWILAHRFFIIYFQYFYQRYVFVLGLCSLLLSKSSSGALSRIRGRVRLSPSPYSLPPPWASFPLRIELQAKPSKLHPAPGASKCGWESLREQQVSGLKSCSVHRHSRQGGGKESEGNPLERERCKVPRTRAFGTTSTNSPPSICPRLIYPPWRESRTTDTSHLARSPGRSGRA